MRPLVFFPLGAALLAAASDVRLMPNDVPVECAAICGPIVELTSICFVPGSGSISSSSSSSSSSSGAKMLLHRRHQPRQQLPPSQPLPHEPHHVARQFGQIIDNVIVIAPNPRIRTTITRVITQPREAITTTVFAPFNPPQQQLPPQTAPAAPVIPTANLGGAVPVPVATTVPFGFVPIPTPVPDPLTTALPRTTSGLPGIDDDELADARTGMFGAVTDTTNTVVSTSLGLPSLGVGGSRGGSGQMPNMADDLHRKASEAEAAELGCVCLNTSFDVAAVAPLCASCIQQAGDLQSARQYTPDTDRLTANVQVKATKPNVSAATPDGRARRDMAALLVVAALMAVVHY